jgi:hypothetical protein
LKAFFWRLKEKYVIRDFHPLVFFYVLGIPLTLAGLGRHAGEQGHALTAYSSSSACGRSSVISNHGAFDPT